MKKKEVPEERKYRGTQDCVVGIGVKVEGRLSCGGFLRVEGECTGSLESSGGVVIAEGAEINADVKSRSILVAGKVSGTLEASDMVRLAPSARVKGNIMSRHFSMDEGAVFSGKVGRSAE